MSTNRRSGATGGAASASRAAPLFATRFPALARVGLSVATAVPRCRLSAQRSTAPLRRGGPSPSVTRPAIERLPLCGPGRRPFTSRSPGEAACTPIDYAALDCSSGTSTRVRAACGTCEERGRSALPPMMAAPLPYLRLSPSRSGRRALLRHLHQMLEKRRRPADVDKLTLPTGLPRRASDRHGYAGSPRTLRLSVPRIGGRFHVTTSPARWQHRTLEFPRREFAFVQLG